jgi:transposase-like protein
MAQPNPKCPKCGSVTQKNGFVGEGNNKKQRYKCTDIQCNTKFTAEMGCKKHSEGIFEQWLNSDKTPAKIAADFGVAEQTVFNQINKGVKMRFNELTAEQQTQRVIDENTEILLNGLYDKIRNENPTWTAKQVEDRFIQDLISPTDDDAMLVNFGRLLNSTNPKIKKEITRSVKLAQTYEALRKAIREKYMPASPIPDSQAQGADETKPTPKNENAIGLGTRVSWG